MVEGDEENDQMGDSDLPAVYADSDEGTRSGSAVPGGLLRLTEALGIQEAYHAMAGLYWLTTTGLYCSKLDYHEELTVASHIIAHKGRTVARVTVV